MIEFQHLTYSYPASDPRVSATPVLGDLSLRIEEGTFVLLAGPSGAGKSTLLRCINGLVPHFYGGTIQGQVRVAGLDPIALAPRRMSEVAGFVFQDPEAQSVVDRVEDEIAFAMENQGLDVATMRQRVEEVLERVDIVPLRHRALSTLSGGERQRVAIASVLALHPRVLVLDEPTSQLDPQSAAEVLETVVRLNQELGLTVVLSEHRLERVVQYADRLLYLPGSGERPLQGSPREVLCEMPLVPPIVELGRHLGWSPLPLTVKEARRSAHTLPSAHSARGDTVPQAPQQSAEPQRDLALDLRGVRFSYLTEDVLRGVDLAVRRGELVAIVGRNGAGKTTLLKHCVGLLKPDKGQVRVLGEDTAEAPVEQIVRHVGYVPQNPNALLFADTIAQELAFTRTARGLPPGDDAALLRTLGLAGMDGRYPRDLSVGERQRVALSAVLIGDPEVILLDEPTRGLDYTQKKALIAFLQAQRSAGRTVVVVTHDVELVAQCAERVVLMEDGRIAVDGPMRAVLSASPAFCTEIGRLSGDPRFLTVRDVVGDRTQDGVGNSPGETR